MFSLQQTVHFSPEAKYVPTDFKDKDLIVRKLGKDGRIHFALKGSPQKTKLSSTTADRIVAGPIVSNPPRFEGGSQAGVDDFAGDPELGHKAARFGLKLNDFFATPPSAHAYMHTMTGIQTATAFDPVPERHPYGEDYDARTAGWESPFFCNMPFSQTEIFIEKAVSEVEKGKEGIIMFDAEKYLPFHKTFTDKLVAWQQRCQFRVLTCSEGVHGIGQTWIPWRGLLNPKLRGPRFGVVIIHLVQGSGEVLLPVTADAKALIAEVSTVSGRAPTTPPVQLPIQISEGVELKILELFCGTGSFGKIAEKIPNCRVISVDINAETAGYKPTLVTDILKLDFRMLGFVPDIIWARSAQPCTDFTFSKSIGVEMPLTSAVCCQSALSDVFRNGGREAPHEGGHDAKDGGGQARQEGAAAHCRNHQLLRRHQ